MGVDGGREYDFVLRWRRLLPAAWLALTIAVLLPDAASATTFGANVGSLFPIRGPTTSATVTELTALRATGATEARSDTFWGITELQPPVDGRHTYDWTYDDGVVTALAEAGLQWQPIVDYATWWASNSDGGPNPGVAPVHLADYAAYAAALAARYGDNGTFWAANPQLTPRPVRIFEIWNEPNLAKYWGPRVDLAEYASLYLQARAAIKAVQPQATVIIGGLASQAPPILATLQQMVSARPELIGHVDGLGFHPYGDAAGSALSQLEVAEAADRATMDAPLYVNEFGWGRPGTWMGATEADRDAYIGQMVQQLGQDPLVADIEIYCWGGPSSMAIYGTPAADAFASAIAALEPPAGAVDPTTTTTTGAPPSTTPSTTAAPPPSTTATTPAAVDTTPQPSTPDQASPAAASASAARPTATTVIPSPGRSSPRRRCVHARRKRKRRCSPGGARIPALPLLNIFSI